MKVLKILGILLLLVLVLALVASLLLPKQIEVEREKIVDAPIDVVWTMVSTLDSQNQWSPWMNLDTAMESAITGKDGEPGAIHSWKSGMKNVGEGEHELTAVDAENYRVESIVRFIKPFESEASIWITLEEGEDEGTTKVTWGFAQESPVFTNLMFTIMNVKGSIAKDFDTGLESLNSLSMALSLQKDLAPEPAYQIREENRPMTEFIGKKETVSFDGIKAYFDRAMPMMYGFAMQGMADTSQPVSALYYDWNESNNTTEMTAALVKMGDRVPEGMEVYTLDSGKCLIIDYYGSYNKLGEAHGAMDIYMKDHKYEMRLPVIEEYVTDPMSEPDSSKWLTRIVYPIQ